MVMVSIVYFMNFQQPDMVKLKFFKGATPIFFQPNILSTYIKTISWMAKSEMTIDIVLCQFTAYCLDEESFIQVTK